ncbi:MULTISPECIES: hypothetical protein [unclassified Leucobacter]|uniref:hypothetical protein n=1 Tax=unclassified Leucobacter TaxID=2621730 RepID=UPI0030161290
MTISITSTKAALLEAELRADLENEKTNEADYLEYVKNPGRRERPLLGLTEIRESIEIISLKLAEATKDADAERRKLPTAATARKLLRDAEDEEAQTRNDFYAAARNARDALNALKTAHRAHQASIGNGIRALTNAGIPVEGAELDGEPIELRGGIHHGSITLRAVNEPITYEWAPTIERYLTKE